MLKHTKLNLAPYCDGCEELSPKVDTLETASILDTEMTVCVTCKNAKKCEKMRLHILSTVEETN